MAEAVELREFRNAIKEYQQCQNEEARQKRRKRLQRMLLPMVVVTILSGAAFIGLGKKTTNF